MLALGAGAVTGLALPPWGWWPLGFVGVALFKISLGLETTPLQRFIRGSLFGAGWLLLGMGWMVQLTLPGYIAAGVIFALYHGVAQLLAPRGNGSSVSDILGAPAAHTLAESLRFSFPFGGVPLASMGLAQVNGPAAPLARVGGAILLTWIVFQVGFMVGHCVLVWARDRDAAGVRFALLVAGPPLVAIALTGLIAPNGDPTGEVINVAIVQGGGEQGTSALQVPPSIVTERHLETTAAIDASRDLDVVLWPENTIDVNDVDATAEFEGFATSTARMLVAQQARRLDAAILVGVTEDVVGGDIDSDPYRDPADPSESAGSEPSVETESDSGLDDLTVGPAVVTPQSTTYTNAQIVVEADGSLGDRYDKVRRVPFGEYVPLRSLLELVSSDVDRVGDTRAGTERGLLNVSIQDGTVPMGVVISWEVFFGGRAREGVKDGAEVILNPTNGASYTGTIVQTQQVASSQLRALETGRWVLQAAPTGLSAVIDSDGNVLQRSSISERTVIYADVPLRSGTTWYVSIGDGPYIFLMIAVCLLAWASARVPRTSSSMIE